MYPKLFDTLGNRKIFFCKDWGWKVCWKVGKYVNVFLIQYVLGIFQICLFLQRKPIIGDKMVFNRMWRGMICKNVAGCAQLMNPWIGLFDPRRSAIKAQTVWKAITSRIAKQNEKLENIWLASNREREVGIGKSSSIKGSASVLYLNITVLYLNIGSRPRLWHLFSGRFRNIHFSKTFVRSFLR